MPCVYLPHNHWGQRRVSGIRWVRARFPKPPATCRTVPRDTVPPLRKHQRNVPWVPNSPPVYLRRAAEEGWGDGRKIQRSVCQTLCSVFYAEKAVRGLSLSLNPNADDRQGLSCSGFTTEVLADSPFSKGRAPGTSLNPRFRSPWCGKDDQQLLRALCMLTFEI